MDLEKEGIGMKDRRVLPQEAKNNKAKGRGRGKKKAGEVSQKP